MLEAVLQTFCWVQNSLSIVINNNLLYEFYANYIYGCVRIGKQMDTHTFTNIYNLIHYQGK